MTINELKPGHRFTTREGQFGQHSQDYFAVKVSTLGEGMLIYAVSANMSSNKTALDRELEIPSYSTGYYEIFRDATGRWYATWPTNERPILLERVELPTPCALCDGVRNVNMFGDVPLCIDCRGKYLGGRICDCAPYGQHIPVFCDRCGAAHSTKNIGAIGSRTVHPIYEDSCSCRDGWYFHDCHNLLFVKGAVVDGRFVKWVDKYEESK